MFNKHLLGAFVMTLIVMSSCIPFSAAADLQVYAADSLLGPMTTFINEYYTPVFGVNVNLTCKGSNALINDITKWC